MPNPTITYRYHPEQFSVIQHTESGALMRFIGDDLPDGYRYIHDAKLGDVPTDPKYWALCRWNSPNERAHALKIYESK